MKIGIDQLRRGVYQVGRALLTPHPTYANDALATSCAIKNERRRQGKPLLDVWFEIHDSNGRHYIIENSDGSGEYRRDLLPSVPPASVVKLILPEGVTPASDLLDQIEGLLKKFQQTTQFLDAPTNEVLELKGDESAQKQIGELLSLIDNIRSATNSAYNEQVASELIEQLDDALLRYAGSKDFFQVEKSVSLVRKTTETMRVSLLSDCTLASFFMVFHDLCTAMLEYRINSGTQKAQAQEEYLRRVAELCNASKLNPIHLLGFSVARTLRDGAREIVVDLANQYLEKGHDLINEALDAHTRHLHGDALYRAAVFLFSSRQLFRILLESAPLLPGLNLEKMKELSNGAEEDNVKVQDALLFALCNRGDELLDAQRERFQELAIQQGFSVVKSKITELVEQKFYYPRIFKECLKGGTKPTEEQV